MKKFVEPHDLEAACASVGVTLAWLSEETGIPQEELRLFARGVHPLLARDRFAIISRLAEVSPRFEREASVENGVKDLQTFLACSALVDEVEMEHREEDAED